MASCVRNIHAKNYQNLVIGFKVTVKNVGDVFLRHSVHLQQLLLLLECPAYIGDPTYVRDPAFI